MKTYPKIEYFDKKLEGSTVWVFDKKDGSNLRFEWSRKRGWYKFGTRTQMIDVNDPNFGDAIRIFINKYGSDLDKIFRKTYSNIESIVVFGEYLGENSFAGKHLNDDIKDVILFDISLYKKGFISPKDFISNFGHLHIPELLYRGEYNQKLVDDVYNNWNLKEGVICKGVTKTKGNEIVWMCKIKTKEWLQKIKALHGERALLEEVNFNKSMVSKL